MFKKVIVLFLVLGVFKLMAGQRLSGGDEISSEFSDRLRSIIEYIETLDQDLVDPAILKEAVNKSSIIIVDKFFDPETKKLLPESYQSLRAWTVPGLFQLKEKFWLENVRNDSENNDLVGHELFRAVPNNLYDDSNYFYSRNSLKLDSWNGYIDHNAYLYKPRRSTKKCEVYVKEVVKDGGWFSKDRFIASRFHIWGSDEIGDFQITWNFCFHGEGLSDNEHNFSTCLYYGKLSAEKLVSDGLCPSFELIKKIYIIEID